MNGMTNVSRTAPGLDYEARAALVVGLNRNLASLTDLAAAYKRAHWNVVSNDFSQLHELFDQVADQTREYMDVVAERAVALGGTARGTIQAPMEWSGLPAFPLEEHCQQHLLEALVARIHLLDADLRWAMESSASEPPRRTCASRSYAASRSSAGCFRPASVGGCRTTATQRRPPVGINPGADGILRALETPHSEETNHQSGGTTR
jgi:starvation-inducible DNA-binding protein